MIRMTMILAGIAAGIVGCAKPPPDLLGQAHESARPLAQASSSAAFDDAYTQVFPEKGLVCGGRMKVPARGGEDAHYERYYFSRTGGVALEGESPSWLPLANACIAATLERLAVTNHRLAIEGSGVRVP